MDAKEALEYLQKEDMKNKEIGKYIVNDDFYYLVQEYDSKALENCVLESHDIYTDIQMVVEGEEYIGTCTREEAQVRIPYNPEKDCTLYELNEEKLTLNIVKAGEAMILPPDVVHMPGRRIGENPVKIRKVVGKVK